MPFRDGAEVRRQRIQEVMRITMSLLNTSEKGEIPLSLTIAQLEYETGLRPEKILEYLKIGEKLKRFEIDRNNDKIVKVKISE